MSVEIENVESIKSCTTKIECQLVEIIRFDIKRHLFFFIMRRSVFLQFESSQFPLGDPRRWSKVGGEVEKKTKLCHPL